MKFLPLNLKFAIAVSVLLLVFAISAASDIRNGLYVLRYTGPHAAEVNAIQFLEGNSNLRSVGNFQ